MSLSPPTNSGLNLLNTQTPVVRQPTIDSGINTGSVFNGQGNDFLDPNKILGNVDDFSHSISPVGRNTKDPLGKNANPSQILLNTNSAVKTILSSGFGVNVPAPSVNQNPLNWKNPDPNSILLGILNAQNNILGTTPTTVAPTVPIVPVMSTSTQDQSMALLGSLFQQTVALFNEFMGQSTQQTALSNPAIVQIPVVPVYATYVPYVLLG